MPAQIASGTRLGAYEIIAPLGAGGMGEVYRALDTRLQREVAIKGLPDTFAQDPERLARFEREARLLASLNHSNIAAIFGLVDAADQPYLVLELVEGENLAQRLARGALPVRETLEIGGQIAAAMEAAHERGIVHRDLKPGNVMLTPARTVKVLDFGLARGGATEAGSSTNLSASPTMALSATGAGVILGTAAYMSPEQARGHAVDRRTDVWSFGCVLFECLSGRQCFGGDTVSDVIARILEREPDWSALPVSAPPRLREVIRRCLTKDAAQRPRDIGDLRLELAAIAQELSSGTTRREAETAAPSLAVLYFENMASDDESAYFCAGITEDILTDLSKIRGLRVASRNAVARYRGAPVDIAKVAAELGVGAVLEGSVRRAGNRVRITAQLIAADGFHLWADRFDRTMDDVFAVQEEIASAIAGALKVALSPAESASLVKDRPRDVNAYDLYLKGRERYAKYTDESLREGLLLFQQATTLDPGYALAWAGTADCYAQLCQWGRDVNEAEYARLGLEASERAITLNPRLPEAYKAKALNLRFLGDHAGSRSALRQALEVNPRFHPALINSAVAAYSAADVAGAERYVRRAIDADPQEPFARVWLGVITVATDRFDEAVACAEHTRTLSDDSFYVTGVHLIKIIVALHRNDLAAAERLMREAAADGARADSLQAAEAILAACTGRAEEARRLVRELERVVGLNAWALTLAAGAAARVGEDEIGRRFLARRLLADLADTHARLFSEVHPFLDDPPLAPRRRDATLIWPLEAPMIDRARFLLFREVRIESGIPEASDLR